MRPTANHSLCLAALVLFVATACGAHRLRADESNWPQFRGQQARGMADNAALPDTWSATENIAWNTAIPGRGWSCPIVWGNRVFVTSVTGGDETLDTKDQKRGIFLGGDRKEAPKNVHRWRVTCLDLADGKVLWERVAHEGVPPQSIHLKNSYASETPVTDGERVYVYFGNLGVYCYSIAGEPLWSRPMTPCKTADGMGTASSPTLHAGRLYILNDNEEQSFLAAHDARTGEEIWRVPRTEKSCWSTPYVWQSGPRTEIVTCGSGTARSYDLDGKLLWQLGDMSAHSIPSPVAGPGLLYLSSGHVLSSKRPIVAVRPGASGDITLAADQTSNDFVAWYHRKAAPYNPSPLLYQDYLYVVTDLGIAYCYDAQSGAAKYEKKRLPNGRAFTASPWAYNGHVFCLSEYGDTFVIKAGPEFEVLRVNSLGEDEMCMATPAIAGDTLLLRTGRGLLAIRKPASAAGPAAK